MNRGEKKFFSFVFWILITVFGVYMTFFAKKESPDQKEPEVSEEKMIDEKSEKFVETQEYISLPEEVNDSENETYSEGMQTEVYFSNTTVIDEGSLPLEVHSILVKSAQKYLNRSGYEDVTELYVDDESYIEDGEHIAFNCFMDGHSSQLRIVFEINDSKLKFSIIE